MDDKIQFNTAVKLMFFFGTMRRPLHVGSVVAEFGSSYECSCEFSYACDLADELLMIKKATRKQPTVLIQFILVFIMI
jgi:hypothetical protein